MKSLINWAIDIWWTIPMGIGSFELLSLANKLMNQSSTLSFWAGILLWIACASLSVFAGFFFAKGTYRNLFK
jgi:hypothetical protein